ncbi:MAG TPA: carbohydrate ABC transporter permease, partial [Clostridia bacterium]|nr:carbohydrate ABC transporter permease [Clostridia bacterium]
DSMEESALLDGANDLQILFYIYLPLSTAVLAVITMYYGVGYWNSYYPSLMFHTDRQLYPLQMFLREVLIANSKSQAGDITAMAEEAYYRELVKYCTVVVTTVPILIVYPFLQRYFVKGVMIGAIKG